VGDIIGERSRVVLEYRLVAMDVLAEHSGLRKALLSRTWVEEERRKVKEVVAAEEEAGTFE